MKSCGTVRCILDTITRCGYYAAPLMSSITTAVLQPENVSIIVLSRPDHFRDMPVRLIDEDNKYAGRE